MTLNLVISLPSLSTSQSHILPLPLLCLSAIAWYQPKCLIHTIKVFHHRVTPPANLIFYGLESVGHTHKSFNLNLFEITYRWNISDGKTLPCGLPKFLLL